MEPAELMCEEWGSLSGLYTAEEADFMAQLLNGSTDYSITDKQCGIASFSTNNTNSYFPSNISNANFFCEFSQGNNSSSCSSTDDSVNAFSTKTSATYSCDPASNLESLSMVFCLGDTKCSNQQSFQWNENLSQQINENTDEESGLDSGKMVLTDNNMLAKREYQMMVSEHSEEDMSINQENTAKRFRSSIEVSKTLGDAKSRKIPKSVSMCNGEEVQWHCSNSYFSHGDFNASLLSEGVALKDPATSNLSRKSRATNGPATDPQSLYARKRRERINERLRILQNLVPNGTKVDISTMLEEAVQYVKFLHLQIKLLSSDDLWMYAPIAYNGMNIGLDLSISPTKGR